MLAHPLPACLDDTLEAHLAKLLSKSDQSLRKPDIESANDQIDLFIVGVQRNMGTNVSLHHAFELVDVALLDVKRYIADPAETYAVALDYALKSEVIEAACDLLLKAPPRPIDPEGVDASYRVLVETIQSYHLPDEQEQILIDYADRISAFARKNDPTDARAFVTTLEEFQNFLAALEGIYVTAAQADRLTGLVLFGSPGAAATCIIPLTWKAQLLILLGAVVIGGIVLVFNSVQAALAARRIRGFTLDTTLTPEEVGTSVSEEAGSLSDAEKQEIIDALEQEKANLSRSPFLRPQAKAAGLKRIQAAIDALQQ